MNDVNIALYYLDIQEGKKLIKYFYLFNFYFEFKLIYKLILNINIINKSINN